MFSALTTLLSSSVWSAVTQVIGWFKSRSDQANTPSMVAQKEAQQEAQEVAKDEKAVAEGDLKTIRERNS